MGIVGNQVHIAGSPGQHEGLTGSGKTKGIPGMNKRDTVNSIYDTTEGML